MTDLLPCPFCNGEAEITESTNADNTYKWQSVSCAKCEASAEPFRQDWLDDPLPAISLAKKAWNRRTTPTDEDLRKIAEETSNLIAYGLDFSKHSAELYDDTVDIILKSLRKVVGR